MVTTPVRDGGRQGREKLNCSAIVVIEAKANPMAGAGMALQNWDSGDPQQVGTVCGLLWGAGITLGKAAFFFKGRVPGRMHL